MQEDVGLPMEKPLEFKLTRKHGLLVREAALELHLSPRTIYRMITDGRLKAELWLLPNQDKGFYWLIDPVSVAKLLLTKEATGMYPRPSLLLQKEAGANNDPGSEVSGASNKREEER